MASRVSQHVLEVLSKPTPPAPPLGPQPVVQVLA